MTSETVQNLIYQAEKAMSNKHGRRMSEKEKELILKMRKNKRTLRHISEKTGYSISTLSRFFKLWNQ